MPPESYIRKICLPNVCATIVQIKKLNYVHEKIILVNPWTKLQLQANGWKVANVIVTPLEENLEQRTYLLSSIILDTTNTQSVANLVISSLKTLWNKNMKRTKENYYYSIQIWQHKYLTAKCIF